ncbi:hypothetical protein BHE74_00039063 [Ensete ventricosum]|nr:hypothetical protein BHE74_00039063 [Ensete ventricosum]RZS15575.1 hypothetical protein BHM03_00047436 [Ensete ventricosum]
MGYTNVSPVSVPCRIKSKLSKVHHTIPYRRTELCSVWVRYWGTERYALFSSPHADEKSSRLLPTQVRRSCQRFPLFLIASYKEKAMRRRLWRRSCCLTRFSSFAVSSQGSPVADISDSQAAASQLEGGTVRSSPSSSPSFSCFFPRRSQSQPG